MPLKYILFFLLLTASLVLNFGMPKKIIDQIQMVTVVGYDFVDEDTIQGTVVTPTFSRQGKVTDLIYTDTASLVYENRGKLNSQASEELYNGKMEIALFNKELAEHGLRDYLDYLLRDPGIGTALILGIVEESTFTFLNSLKSKKGAGIYLSELHEHNIKNGNLPTTNLKEFSSSLVSKTSDAFLPMLNLENGVPKLTALAFFENDKFVESISIEKAFTFKMLYESIGDGQYNYTSDAYKASIQNINSSRDFRVEKKNGSTKVTIDVKFEGVVREYTGKELSKRIPKFEKDLEKDFKQKAEKLIKRFQELNIDPLAVEEHVRSSIRTYDKKQFKAHYQTMPIDVKISFTLTESGTRR